MIRNPRRSDLSRFIEGNIERQRGVAPAAMTAAIAFGAMLAVFAPCSCTAGSTFTVNTAGDPGPGGTVSLRQAVASANASSGNKVQFDASLVGSTITLASGEVFINQPMDIIGPGAGLLTISGNDASRIFRLKDCPGGVLPVSISGLTLTHGHTDGAGGAIYADHCGVSLSNSRITDSYAGIDGGSIAAYVTPEVIILGSLITGNSAGIYGGAIDLYQSSAYVISSTISGNISQFQGGGVRAYGGSLFLYYSTVSGNVIPPPLGDVPSQGGGGLMISGAKFHAVNSTIAGNYAYAGGSGVALVDSYAGNNASITWSTIAGNNSCCYETGNGITSTSGTPTVKTSIVANNFNRVGIYDLSGSFKVYGSLVRNAGTALVTGSGSLFGVDPKLSKLADHGGATWTMLPAADSPAVDTNNCDVATPALDQRGFTRCVNGVADMGAVERQSPEDGIFRDGFDLP
jgi:hypothetical protein